MSINSENQHSALSDGSSDDENVTRSLLHTRRMATFALVWERFWPLAVPILAVVAIFLIISWFGLWPLMAAPLRWALVLGLAVLLVIGLAGLRAFQWPSQEAVDRRIETSSVLSHRPVTAQSDTNAKLAQSEDPFAKALWREHQARARGQLGYLKSGTPTPQVARRDPFALRALVALVLFVAVFAGRDNWQGHVMDAFRDHSPTPLSLARIDAWIKTPPYTNRPPIFLSRAEGLNGYDDQTDLSESRPQSVKVPQGSELVVRLLNLDNAEIELSTASGNERIEPKVDENAVAASEKVANNSTSQAVDFEAVLSESGTINLLADGKLQTSWAFTIIPDTAPSIEFVEDPKPSARGALELSYEMEDDYGVASARALVTLTRQKSTANARPLIGAPEIRLSTGSRRSGKSSAKTSTNLASHPWAGAEADIVLEAQDDAGQTAQSLARRLVLPGRIFTKPLAQAIVFERRRLALDANAAQDVAEMLDIMTSTHPEIFIPNISHYTALRVAFRHIKRAETDDALRDGLEQLWQIALAVEDGNLSAAERRLREAQERLAEAIERGASEEEISNLMQELRQAMNEFLREMQEQFAKNNQNQQAQQLNRNSQTLRQQDLERMMQQIEDLAKSGSKDAARELLRQMQEMLNNLEMAQPQQNRQNDPFGEQMNKLGEMMRQQQQLMDETFSMQRQQQQQGNRPEDQQNGNRQQQQQNGQQGEQRPMTPEEFAEAMKKLQQQQGDLQKQMQELQQAMRELGLNPGEKMNEAGEAMGEAEGNLGEGETGQATGNQGRALQAMREGAQRMMQQMQQQAGEQGREGERGQHGEQTRRDADPLGRQSRSRAPQLGNDTKVPGEIDAQRAREILDAIRKRLGEQARPKLELDYLDRLLPTR